ncbi:cation:proton antiporter [Mycoplasmatota bacterium]|nr:cation:proton antiporter [Mycoplasmatota bacterium]
MSLFTQIAIAFLALAIAGFISKFLKSFNPPFYIVAGILLGPAVFSIVNNEEVFSLLGDIGLIFLLFYLGYEFSLNKLVDKKKVLGLAGLIDFIVNFSIAFLLGMLLDLSWFYTFVFAGMIYMSSSSIITKSLIQLGAVKKEEGQVVMGIMIFEDIVMIGFLVIIQSIVNHDGFELLSISKDIGLAVLFAFIVIFLGRKYSSYIDKLINLKNHELAHIGFIAFIFIGVVIGVLFGVSEALSAFLLGLVVSELKHKDRMEEVILKFRDIFGAVFFFYFGMTFAFESITVPFYILLIISFVAIIGKLVSGYLMQMIEKCNKDGGLFIGIVTIPRGEFSLIIAGIVAAAEPQFANVAVVVILVTSFMTTIIFYIINKLCKHKEICVLSKQFLNDDHKGEANEALS